MYLLVPRATITPLFPKEPDKLNFLLIRLPFLSRPFSSENPFFVRLDFLALL